MNRQQFDVIVAGAGIAGLTAAFKAKKKGFKVRVLESSSRAGGVIQSEWKNNYLLEYGPNTVLPTTGIMDLINDLGIKSQVNLLNAKTPRYIQKNKKLFPLPLSPGAFLKTPLISLKGKLRLLKEPFLSPPRDNKDESLTEFIERRLGEEICSNFVKPFVSGVWAGDADKLSARSSFPKLKHWEDWAGSVIKGALKSKKNGTSTKKPPKGLLSFVNGLESLPKALGHSLFEEMGFQESVTEIKFNQEGRDIPWKISTNNHQYESRHLVLALPAHQSANLLTTTIPEAAHSLNQIPYASLAVLHFSIDKKAVTHSLKGFGYLNQPHPSNPVLGCLWSSSLFPNRSPEEKTLLTLFLGGALHPAILKKSDEELRTHVMNELETPLGIKSEPTLLSLKRYDKAIPQYTIGHLHRVEILKEAEKKWDGLHFTGNYIEGISVGDVIESASKLTF